MSPFVEARVLMVLHVWVLWVYGVSMYKMMLATTTFSRQLVGKIIYDHSG